MAVLGYSRFIPRSYTDMETSLGSWIPAGNYFPDQNSKIKRKLRGYFQARLQSRLSGGGWVWPFGLARSQGGAQGIPLTQPGPAGPLSEQLHWNLAALFPQSHKQCAVLPGEWVPVLSSNKAPLTTMHTPHPAAPSPGPPNWGVLRDRQVICDMSHVWVS